MAASSASVGRCLLLALCFGAASSKVFTGTARLGHDSTGARNAPWSYIGKFGWGFGVGTYRIRVRARKQAVSAPPLGLTLELFLDEEWDRVEPEPFCAREKLTRKAKTFNATREWSDETMGQVVQNIRPHIWYFALTRCKNISDLKQPQSAVEVEYELRLTQEDDSEFSFEVRQMPIAVTLSLLCLCGFLFRFGVRCKQFQHSTGELHPVIIALAVAVLLHFASQVLHLLHLVAFERRGVSTSVFGAFTDILFMLSQVVSSALLLIISQGYTLSRSKDSLVDQAKPIVAVLALVHVMLVGHSIMLGERADTHHDNGGITGWALVLVRLVLYGWFVTGMQALLRTSEFKLQPFLLRFSLVGSMYFLAYPIIFFVVRCFAEYLQHPLMEIFMTLMQTGSALWLSELFLGRGEYYQVSTLSSSLLPGGCGSVSGAKQE